MEKSSFVLLLGIVCALAALQSNSYGQQSPSESAIVIGPVVQVSKARASLHHGELLVGADPTNSGRLLTCVMVLDKHSKSYSIVYYSSDNGNTWTPTLEKVKSDDPACAFDGVGGAYFVSLSNGLSVYRSADGGHTWGEASWLPGDSAFDRPFVSADSTESRFRGQVYISAFSADHTSDVKTGLTSVALFTSKDSGRTWDHPTKVSSVPPLMLYPVPSNPAVLSDGAVVIAFAERKPGAGMVPNSNPHPYSLSSTLKVVQSHDGGVSLGPPVTISDIDLLIYGSLLNVAVDPGSAAFKDRIYVVWTDTRTGQGEIMLAYSADKGKTWSKPRVIGNDRSMPSGETAKDNFQPVVAVNREGIVGVSWYDRRESEDNLGYRVRFAASLDGGETWLPSVPLSAPTAWNQAQELSLIPNSFQGDYGIPLLKFTFTGGDTAGMAPDANGVFHPVWIDNHTGIPQVWTAAVKVKGPAVKHGSTDLASLDDVTEKVKLELSDVHMDRTSGIVSVAARLSNISKESLLAPFRVRLIRLESAYGDLSVENSDNGYRNEGAVWSFDGLVNGGVLKAGEVSEPKQLLFRLRNPRPLASARKRSSRLLEFAPVILAKLSP